MRAEFSEKAFEIAYDVELAVGPSAHVQVYAPSQVFEDIVGFDAASNPDASHVVWRVIQTPRPKGVILLPSLWPEALAGASSTPPLPRHLVSFIVQFKRPDYLQSHRATQWSMWRTPYYRFTRTADQQQVLKRLEAHLRGEAVVRYAAPAFCLQSELEVAQLSRTVIASSGHVSPEELGNHRVWTYTQPGHYGRGNPAGRPTRFDRFETLFDDAAPNQDDSSGAELVQLRGLDEHLRRVAEVAERREPALRSAILQWRSALEAQGVPFRIIEGLTRFATIRSLCARIGASWWLLDADEVRPTR